MICKRICVGLRDPNAPSGHSAGAVILIDAMSSWENKKKKSEVSSGLSPKQLEYYCNENK